MPWWGWLLLGVAMLGLLAAWLATDLDYDETPLAKRDWHDDQPS